MTAPEIRVVFLRSAQADLREIRSYVVRHFGRPVWQAGEARIRRTVALIQSHPQAGKVPPELARLGITRYRQVLSGRNRLIYEVRDGVAYIHLVCDTRRDLQDLLMRRLVSPGA